MHNSDSLVQLNVEKLALDFLRIDYPDILSRPVIPALRSFQVDAYSEDSNAYFEIYAGIDELKPGQKKKLCCDILKLITIEKITDKPVKKFIVLIDRKIEAKLKSDSWLSKSIVLFGIEVIVIDITNDELNKIRVAKARQNILKIR